ncbi:caspase family protein [Allorhodopirellula heiligendammensis]|uniref:Caspase domain protein n=1 Tax=Allorhodopirellula heiligendammensis TaxID=2714739 RepID=A0A5C6BI73_9BACT|nr:caspase family protein [Allorhodopirellula heiligendammensis]TWU10144.1 Caspase domain protein [Allorhodopirellula heiligendammensis]
MANEIYALLVGINDYPSHVGRLYGCVNDVQHFSDYLLDNYDRNRLHIETLLDADATRENVIERFRAHLGRADKDDVCVFQYCGHGARSKSAVEFRKFYPDGWDEGLVCYNSRDPGCTDLADKELAVLLAEVAKNSPHLAVIFDCCHSGSATRSADDFTQFRARQTHEIPHERPLESYLDGFYIDLLNKGESLEIPVSRHILLAACERVQKAWEGNDHRGVFTSTLLEVLEQSGTRISYADLFVRCRAMVRKRADNQNPQFETYKSFNAYGDFLSGVASQAARRYSVSFENNGWQVACGALHGLASAPEQHVELALYSESSPTRLAGYATTTRVGPQKSDLKLLDLEADSSARYQAEITSLPVPPLAVNVDGDAAGIDVLQDSLAASENRADGFALLHSIPARGRYLLVADDGRYLLKHRETGELIQGAIGYTQQAAAYMFSILKRIAAWERAVTLRNESTRLELDDVPFKFCEVFSDTKQYEYPGAEITIGIDSQDGDWKVVRGTLKAENRSSQPLHMLLTHFSEDYGIQVLYNERIEPTDAEFTITLDGNAVFNLALEECEGDDAIHTFKIIVSTEKVDDFLIGQEPLKLGEIAGDSATRGLSFGPPRKKLAHKNEWFTKDLRVRLVREIGRVSEQETTLANRQITIKGHPSFQAGVSLLTPESKSRGVVAGAGFERALERQGMELLSFAGTRGDSDTGNVLEFSDIQNPETLTRSPLEIELNVDLADDEFILPLTFDGEHILLTGDPTKCEGGRTQIRISHLPNIPDNRRSLGGALKLYFFKTYLRRSNVNKICWVEYKSDGSIVKHQRGVAARVAAAKNVLLLIHGIIGDTDGIAQGLTMARDANGRSVDEQFDLVLTYDYENLSTSIADTAVALQQQLAEVGLSEHDDVRLTLLVHSMGGLVSRWFIEREGGNAVVDHLVMFGTPNIGSPFGAIDSARQLCSVLTTLAINTFPAITPWAGALVYLLNRSKNVTPTLEQMNVTSEFIYALNSSLDPNVRYTIIAGDIRDYYESTDQIMARLIAKVGSGVIFDALYRNEGHDIAVAYDSIQGVPGNRTPAPQLQLAVCHHLNYFSSDAGLKAMASIQW